MIKPASSLCNLRCKYCFYANVSDLREVKSYGIMSDEIVEKMLAKIYDELSDNDQLDIAFQGGEPTLASLSLSWRIFVCIKLYRWYESNIL